MVEPSGQFFKYYGCATGKGQNAAKTELEKIQSKVIEELCGIVRARQSGQWLCD